MASSKRNDSRYTTQQLAPYQTHAHLNNKNRCVYDLYVSFVYNYVLQKMNKGLPRHTSRPTSAPPIMPAPPPILHPTPPSLNNVQYSNRYAIPVTHHNQHHLPRAPPSPSPSLNQPQLPDSFHNSVSRKPLSTFPTNSSNGATPVHHQNYAPSSHNRSSPIPHTHSQPYYPTSPNSRSSAYANISSSPPRAHTTPPSSMQPLILESVFNTDRAFEDLKKTIANTIKYPFTFYLYMCSFYV